jgi:hypothetical protein
MYLLISMILFGCITIDPTLHIRKRILENLSDSGSVAYWWITCPACARPGFNLQYHRKDKKKKKTVSAMAHSLHPSHPGRSWFENSGGGEVRMGEWV